MTNTEYVEHFKALVRVIETYGGAYGREPGLVAELFVQGMKPEDVDTADCAATIKAKEVCRECYLSCMLLHGTNNSLYFQLRVDPSNDTTKGTDNYPKTIVETLRLLTDYVTKSRLQCARDLDGEGLAFVRISDCMQGIEPCKCKGKGHRFPKVGLLGCFSLVKERRERKE